MFHSSLGNRNLKQNGSALVIAIFIIVVMTLLGSALVRMISSSAETVAYEVIGTRAFQSAQIGLQRKLQVLFPLSPTPGSCEPNITYDLSTIKGLENCEARNVVCALDASVSGVNYYTIESTGQCEVAGIITTRTLQVQARNL
mgnify:CR=1 FL=1